MREGYFYKWKDKPPFNAYQSIVYHITAPPYREVLKKRIDFTITNFDFQALDLQYSNKSVKFQKGSLEHLFKNLYDTLFRQENSYVLEFLEETSYPNTRQRLENLKNFLLSGHSKISEYMSFGYEYGDGYGIPIWEFFKSVALDSNYYYETNKSKIVNLFHSSKNNENHFTKLRVLNYLLSKITPSYKKVYYTEVSEIYTGFLKAGYTIDIVKEELQEMFDKKLISTSEYSEDIEEETIIDSSSSISISSIGAYYLNVLSNKFYYLDLILQDTPIYNEDFYEKLIDVFPDSDEYGNRDLFGRSNSVKLFIEYLKGEEKKDKRFISNFDNMILMFDVSSHLENGIATDLLRIDNVIKRQTNSL